MVLILFLAISMTGFLVASDTRVRVPEEESMLAIDLWSDEQWAKNMELLDSDIKPIILDPWFKKQLAMHRCDNHAALASLCSDASCFCKQPLKNKNWDIRNTLLCAYGSWKSPAAMDYILWHELARIRKETSCIDGLTTDNWGNSLFCSAYFKNRNDKGLELFLGVFQRRWEQYRGPRIRHEERWWVRQCVLRVEPRTIEWHAVCNNDDQCSVCMSAEGVAIALYDTEHNTKKYYEYPSGNVLPALDNFKWEKYQQHDGVGIFLDGEKRNYDVHASLPSAQTSIGEIYKLSDTVACYQYEPPTSMVYDERHGCIYGPVSIYENISVWPLIKPKLSPAMRLCMEALRGCAAHPDNGYKQDIAFSDIISAPWTSKASTLKSIVNRVYTKEDENSKELLTEYISNNVTRLSKGYVIKRLLKKHEGITVMTHTLGMWAGFAKGISAFAGTGLLASLALGCVSTFAVVMASGVYAYHQGWMTQGSIITPLLPKKGQSVPTPLHRLRVIQKKIGEVTY
jgi:hypothetical protein